ncbi:MAG: nicotinate (nicotinamide) nucleotide adenylyltransferase [Chloroflexi bacterium]|nr:MAG: nicotinate (nicotinamide) nucleotide adenylyltransferase [Chloroflexota bacterium]
MNWDPVRTGVLGGTFDPPHLAHLVLAAAARRALGLDRVLFVPAGVPWRKAGREVSPAAARVRMLQAAIAPLPWAALRTIEVERDGPSYSAETMETLTAGEPGDWWFILGSDALADLPHWHEPARLLAATKLALVRRPDGTERIPPEVFAALPGLEARIDPVAAPALEISSTDLRARIRDGRPTQHLLPAPVREVIDELGLYR